MNHVLVKAEGIAGSMVCSGDVRERSCLSRMYVKASKGSPEKPTYLICKIQDALFRLASSTETRDPQSLQQ